MKFTNYETFRDCWKSGGIVFDEDGQPSKEKLTLQNMLDRMPKEQMHIEQDNINTSDFSYWIPTVIQEVIKDVVEPICIGTKLLKQIPFTAGQTINIGALDAITAPFTMPESGEYPEVSVQMGPGTAIANTGKYGCAVKFTDEIQRYSSFPIIDLHIMKVVQAMVRFKEQIIFKFISDLGQCAFDNITPSDAEIGSTTGLDLNAVANGSLTIDDLFEAIKMVMRNGFMPDTMILHPATWMMWVKDPILREFQLNHGGGVWFASWSGNPAEAHNPWPNMGGQGISKGNFTHGAGNVAGAAVTPSNLMPQNMLSAPKLPPYADGIPSLDIIVTPNMPFDAETSLTDIIVCNRSTLGYYVEEHPIKMSDFTDPRNDLYKIKLLERWTLASNEEGNGVVTIKNVRSDVSNQINQHVQLVMTTTNTFTPPDSSVSPFASAS